MDTEAKNIIELGQKFSDFRELRPVEFWSASVSLGNFTRSEFEAAVEETVQATGKSVFGFLLPEENLYVRTRYPRRKYGVLSLEECRATTKMLAEKMHTEMVEQEKKNEPRFRIVLGLLEGYEKESITHSLVEVQQELGSDFEIKKGEIFSAGKNGDQTWSYTEPAAVIEGDKEKIQKVYNLAKKFHQERFTVEDLEKGEAFVVETEHCTSRDEE